ncbi:MAG: type II toxin-antitoxin system antitoxin SocA domain-containing protein [Pseudomonadota bacterium]
MSVTAIADDILKLAKRRGLSLTPMQLMKLAYISYGWHLAMRGERLFEDRVEAWKYGPVIPALYHATKHFGREKIGPGFISDGSLSHPEHESFLDGVVERYGSFSGIALSNLTHMPGTPWSQVFKPGVLGIVIPDELIAQHYRNGLDARRRPTSSTT